MISMARTQTDSVLKRAKQVLPLGVTSNFRAWAGRDKIIKFEGAYHGMYDYALWSTYPAVENIGSRRSPIPVQASSGIPEALHGLTITLPFNDFDLLERTFRDKGHEIAAII